MSEIDNDLLDPDEGDSSAMKAVRQALRNAKRELAEAKALADSFKEQADRAAQLERETTFLKAGVPGDKWGSMFAKAYDGDLTVEAVKAAWAELSPPQAPTTPQQPQQPNYLDEASAADRMSSAAPTGFDPSAEAAFEAERVAAKSPEQLIAVLAKYGRLAGPQD